MDVHAHTHSPGKKWHHYFWKFFMLFLAVTLGFFVENQREHLVELQREKKYMQNLLQDIAMDTANIQLQLRFQQRAVKFADSLVFLMNSPDRDMYLRDIYYYARMLGIINPLLFSNATITQLKSSGSLRLIKNESLVDKIVQYDIWTQRIQEMDQNIQNLIRDFRSSMGYVFDATTISQMSNNLLIGNNSFGSFVKKPDKPLPIIANDKKTINQLCLYTDFFASLYQSHFKSSTAQKERATGLITFIKKEYHLK